LLRTLSCCRLISVVNRIKVRHCVVSVVNRIKVRHCVVLNSADGPSKLYVVYTLVVLGDEGWQQKSSIMLQLLNIMASHVQVPF
jgi:hypothetical protein